MIKKRIVAVLAATTMLLSTVPVFAAGATDSATLVTDTATVTTTTSDATVLDENKPDILVVTVPTAKALEVIVDPHNLVGLASGEAVVIDRNATGQGAILSKENALAVIMNKSNFDVKVNANISVKNITGSAITFATQQATVDDNATAQAMFLGVIPSTQKASGASTYVAADKAIAIESAGTDVAFRLQAADYEMLKTGTGEAITLRYQLKDDPNNFDGTAFKLAGSVNKTADWSAYTNNNLKVVAVYTVSKATDTDVLASGSALYALVSGSAVVDYTPVGVKTGYATFVDSDNSFYLGMSEGVWFEDASAVTNVTVNGVECTAQLFGDGSIGVTWEAVKEAGQNNVTSWTFNYTVDGVAYTATFSE